MTPALTVDTLTARHIADLRMLRADPRYPLQPQRLITFRRLGLIRASEPRIAPSEHRRRITPRRAYVLTPLAEQLIGEAEKPAPAPDPIRVVPGNYYLADSLRGVR